MHVVNLDPAAENFDYPVAMGRRTLCLMILCIQLINSSDVSDLYFMLTDIRELISLEDVMEELGLGPNGGLLYCMEYP